jgi:hypothetical protein
MRAHTITTMSPRRRQTRRRRALALALGVCALAIPSTAIASPVDPGTSDYSTPNAITGGSSDSSQPSGGTDYSSVNSITGGSSESSQPTIARPNEGTVTPDHVRYTGPPPFDTSEPVASSDGFDWLSAAVGAGAALALFALGGAALLMVRRRTAMSPSASAS